MADSVTNMPQMSSSQASKEVTFNETVDSLSPAALFGRNANETTALTWGYLGGKYRKGDGTILEVVNGTVALTASATNYIKETDGVVSVTTAPPSGWPSPLSGGAKALYAVKCNATGVDPADWPAGGYKDYRTTGIGSGNSASSGGTSSPLTTKGDLWGFGSADARVPVGTNGQQLVADSTQALGVKWASEPYDIQTFYPGVPTASAKVYRGKLARSVTFPANFAGSQFTATVNATASTVFDIQKNGSSIGSCTIAAGSITPTFATSGGAAVSFAAGDVLAIICPGTPDATLADPAITLTGTR